MVTYSRCKIWEQLNYWTVSENPWFDQTQSMSPSSDCLSYAITQSKRKVTTLSFGIVTNPEIFQLIFSNKQLLSNYARAFSAADFLNEALIFSAMSSSSFSSCSLRSWKRFTFVVETDNNSMKKKLLKFQYETECHHDHSYLCSSLFVHSVELETAEDLGVHLVPKKTFHKKGFSCKKNL